MNSFLLRTCGVTNALFALFHAYLGVLIQRLPSLPPGYRGLMQALNVGGTVMIAFLAVALLACSRDMRTRLGRATLGLGAAIYLTRIGSELVFFPKPSPAIIGICLVAGVLHLLPLRPARATG